jgi:hypothetical protein
VTGPDGVRENLDGRRPRDPQWEAKVDAARYAAAVAAAAIADRRLRCGDPGIAGMPDDLHGLVDYVISHPDVPGPVLRADQQDALTIRAWLDLDGDRQRLALYEGLLRPAGRLPRWTYRDLAAWWRVPKSTAAARVDRMRAQVGAGRRDERLVRQAQLLQPAPTFATAGYLDVAGQVVKALRGDIHRLPASAHYDLGLAEAALDSGHPKLVGLVHQLLDDLHTEHPGYPAHPSLARLLIMAREYLDPARRRRTHTEG